IVERIPCDFNMQDPPFQNNTNQGEKSRLMHVISECHYPNPGRRRSSRIDDLQTLRERLEIAERQVLKLEEEISSIKKMVEFNFTNELILNIVMNRSTTDEEVLQLRRLYRLINDNQDDSEFNEKWSDNLASWLKLIEYSYEKGLDKSCSFNCQLWENISLLLERYEESLPSVDMVSTSPRSPLISSDTSEILSNFSSDTKKLPLFETNVFDVPLEFGSVDCGIETPQTPSVFLFQNDDFQHATANDSIVCAEETVHNKFSL
ncbi:9268_t:CDS:2, partial [Acaulospora colombiana]